MTSAVCTPGLTPTSEPTVPTTHMALSSSTAAALRRSRSSCTLRCGTNTVATTVRTAASFVSTDKTTPSSMVL